MSVFSDRLFFAAVAVYVLTMALQAASYAKVRAAVPAGGGDAGPPPADRPERLARMSIALGILGAALHAASIVTRGLAVERWPLGNMYEFISTCGLAAVVTWLVMIRRSAATRTGATRAPLELRAVGIVVLCPVVILMFLAGTVLYTQAAPVMPALQSYWLVIHVTTIAISSGLLIVPGMASVLYLLRRAGKLEMLPAADVLDHLAYRVTIIAFPLYTFAVICGAIWAEAAWGRFWGWDPKETVAFVAWVIYAAYLHARATAGWRTTGAAWINIVGMATMIFNLFFINLVIAGLHSYAGTS